MINLKSKAAAYSILSNTSLILLKLIAGLVTGSISLIAEAIHSSMDLAAAVIAFISVRISDKPATEEYPFGYGKAENVSGVAEALLIFGAALIIVYQAIGRIINGRILEHLDIGLGIMGVSIVVNVLVSRYLFKISKKTDSLALEADAKHLTTDVATMAGVFVGLLLVRITHLNILDPITAILVSLLIMRTAWDLTRKSFFGLLDNKLPREEQDKLVSFISSQNTRVINCHEVRTRKAGSWRFVDFHLVLPQNASVSEAHEVCDYLEDGIKERLPNSNVTIHVEPCDTECQICHITSCSLKYSSTAIVSQGAKAND